MSVILFGFFGRREEEEYEQPKVFCYVMSADECMSLHVSDSQRNSPQAAGLTGREEHRKVSRLTNTQSRQKDQ